MAETIKYIGSMIASKFGGPLETYNFTSLTNNSLMSAYLGAAQTGLTSGAATKALLDTEVFDTGSNFSSNKFTAPVTGYYHIDWSTYAVSDGGTLVYSFSDLYKGGVHLIYGSAAPPYGGESISKGSGLFYLTAGEYIELYCSGYTSSSTWKIQASTATSMFIYLVSK
jgi:hypothetical protein